MGIEGFHHKSKANQKKRSISNKIKQQTLTLEQRAVGTHLHCPTAGRPRAEQTCAARFVGARHRMLRRSPPGRWGARARARKRGAIHGELDGGALTHQRARAPASKPRWHRPAHSARPPWPAAIASVSWREKTGRQTMNARVPGSPPSPVLFARRTRAAVGSESDGEGATRR